MYWPQNQYIHDTVKDKLTELEQTINRPLRVLFGRARTVDPHPEWTATHLERVLGNPTREEAEANGVTVWFYGTFNENQGYRRITEFYEQPNLWSVAHAAGYIYDVPNPRMPLTTGEPFEIEGVIVGEIEDRSVALHINLNEWGVSLDMEKFLVEPVMMCLDEEARARYEVARQERNFEQFCELLKTSTNAGVAELQRNISLWMETASNAAEQAAQARSQLRDFKNRLAVMLDVTDEASAQANRETAWQRLNNHPKIERLDLIGDQIILQTTDLDLTHPYTEETVYLGKFRFTIFPKTQNIRVHNLTNRKGDYDHPHVHNTRPCFGNIEDGIYEAMVKGDLAMLVELLFVFLTNVNLEDDWGRHAKYWFDQEVLAHDAELAAV